ncbi:MAG: DMT family transporter [candidate division KSB1 bacterium]|nr:DMT family transporter [candidate division KSB1 bacterium]
MPFIGEISALTAAFFWGSTAYLFDFAGKKIGAFPINVLRVFFACLLLGLLLYIQRGYFYPVHVTRHASFWLGISGIIGLAIGDGALFFAILSIGPRLATLVLALAPPLTTIIAWVFLGEKLGIYALLGITLTITSIVWVVSERGPELQFPKHKTAGIIYGIIAAIGQGLGVIFAKIGLENNIDTISATLLRMAPASIALWIMALFTRQAKPAFLAFNNSRVMGAIIIGTVFGPFLGVWLSIVAVKFTAAGIASTLLSTVPVLVIPVEIILFRRIPSTRAIIGTVLAIAGIALIFMR